MEGAAVGAAKAIAAKPPEALASARSLLRGEIDEVSRRIDVETELFTERLGSSEAKEALTAFTQKRPPAFSRR